MNDKVRSGALFREAELMHHLRLKSRSTIRDYVRRGILPEPVRLGGSNRWLAAEVDAAVERAAALRRDAAGRTRGSR